MIMEVSPDVLLFTQDSIRSKFKKPREEERIDNAVDLILEVKVKVTDFPRLEVVLFEERYWSLDNRRLWVFKKARIKTITVILVTYDHHPRFQELVEGNPELKMKFLHRDFWPNVRGKCRKQFQDSGGLHHPQMKEFSRSGGLHHREVIKPFFMPIQPGGSGRLTEISHASVKEITGGLPPPKPVNMVNCDRPPEISRLEKKYVQQEPFVRAYPIVNQHPRGQMLIQYRCSSCNFGRNFILIFDIHETEPSLAATKSLVPSWIRLLCAIVGAIARYPTLVCGLTLTGITCYYTGLFGLMWNYVHLRSCQLTKSLISLVQVITALVRHSKEKDNHY